ncbi:MAG: ISL3 family transposase [Alkalinema sp. RL_2_19]|nr:ISL3 family transposase [Alkalinema sp. RL_2_19]
MDNQFQIPLNLPDVRIIEVSQGDNGWLIRVESTLNETTCGRCGCTIRDFHGDDAPIQLRHLPLFEVPVWIELRPKRYRCPDCDGRTTTQQLSWYQRRSAHTKAYEQWLLKLLINSTVSDVSRKLGVSEACVIGVLDRWVETEVNWDEFQSIAVLGIDEISLKRGHRDFVVIITTKTAQGVLVLGVLADRKQATVEAFLERIPAHLKATIQTVCLDMHIGYVNAVQAQLPKACIVVDRFHVAKAYRDCADTVRKQALKRLKQELPKAQYADLKGVMWAFRQRFRDLDPAQKSVLNRLFVYAPEVEQAYTLREQLTDIFEQEQTKVGATQAIQAWYQRVRRRNIKAFEPFLTTLDNWLDEITNYFHEGQSSGFVEGFNNRIKVLKRRCYGIFNVKHIFQRLTLDRHGYERFDST